MVALYPLCVLLCKSSARVAGVGTWPVRGGGVLD